jgi:hypothetical protein
VNRKESGGWGRQGEVIQEPNKPRREERIMKYYAERLPGVFIAAGVAGGVWALSVGSIPLMALGAAFCLWGAATVEQRQR